jgi:hypothetical protein
MDPDISLLGNAAAVPIVIAITQFLKKSFNFNRKADVISLFVSFWVCLGWQFYYAADADIMTLVNATLIVKIRHTIDLIVVSFATWLSASKSYDLFIGDKKWNKKMEEIHTEKEDLKKQVEVLTNGHEPSEPVAEDADLDQRLRDILEEEERNGRS